MPLDIADVVLKIWWLPVIAMVAAIVRTPRFKGWIGEKLVSGATSLRLPANEYHKIDDVTLETARGTIQIDHVIVSRYGIFVIETKHMKGWIFGRQHEPRWTQKNYRRNHTFQNPLHQNFAHIKALEELLGLPDSVFHSIVVFVGDCTFKTPMPSNVLKDGGLFSYIRGFKTPVLSEEELAEVIAKIQTCRLKPGRRTRKAHIRNLAARHGTRESEPRPMSHPRTDARNN